MQVDLDNSNSLDSYFVEKRAAQFISLSGSMLIFGSNLYSMYPLLFLFATLFYLSERYFVGRVSLFKKNEDSILNELQGPIDDAFKFIYIYKILINVLSILSQKNHIDLELMPSNTWQILLLQFLVVLFLHILFKFGIFHKCGKLICKKQAEMEKKQEFINRAILLKTKKKHLLDFSEGVSFSEVKKNFRTKQLVTFDIFENKKYAILIKLMEVMFQSPESINRLTRYVLPIKTPADRYFEVY